MNQLTSILTPIVPAWRRERTDRPALLRVDDLSIVDARGKTLVDAVSFAVPQGGTIGIVGESGSGKSLTCRAILGALPEGLSVGGGSIRYRDTELVRLPAAKWRDLRALDLAAVFQDPASYLNPSIPVGRQLAEAVRITCHLTRRQGKDAALALLTRVGLDAEAVYGRYSFELSGGMAQRVLIAIAVSAGPKLLIADEATTALDATVQQDVLALLDELRREQGLTLLFVSHDLALVSQVCETVIVMRNGAIVEAGPTRDILKAPAHAYTRSLIDNHRRFSVEAPAAARPIAGEAVAAVADAIVTIRDLHAGYGTRSVLHGVDLDVRPGEILGLVGETGCGKTTLLRSILGLVPVQAGTIGFEGRPLDTLRGQALRRFRLSGRVQYVFQDPLRSLDPALPVGASIGEGLDIRGGTTREARARLVAEAMREVGLDPALAVRRPADLSGGQRQRVVFARALILDPAVLLLDEPVSALDAVSRTRVLDLMRHLAATRGIAQVFISHDLGSIAGVADRLAVLHQGRVVEEGAARDILTRPTHSYTARLLASVPRFDIGTGNGEAAADPARIAARHYS